MSKKNADYLLPLPQNLHPKKFRCVTFFIPDDVDWYMSFWGWIYEMGYGKRFEKNAAHDGLIVAAQWQAIIDAARENFLKRLCEVTPGNQGVDGDEIMIRQNPTNPCLLESSIDGVNWCVFADFSKCLPANGQPGGGGGSEPQPQPGGGCVTYHGTPVGSSVWLLPTIVNTGDTLTLTNGMGATNGNAISRWNCTDGSQFFAGACISGTNTNAGNFLPAGFTGEILYKIAGVYYAALAPFTVPAGVVNEQVEILLNYTSLSGVSGDYSFDVQVCNNQATTFTHTFDFVTGPQGFIAGTNSSACPGSTGAVYNAGTGWAAQEFDCPPVATDYMIDILTKNFPAARTLTGVEVFFTVTLGTHLVYFGNGDQLTLYSGGTPTTALFMDYRTPPASPWIWSGSHSTDRLDIQIIADINQPAGPVNGAANISKIVVTGIGTDPF